MSPSDSESDRTGDNDDIVIEDPPVSEAHRALMEQIERRRDDHAFLARLRRLLEENRRALERLAK